MRHPSRKTRTATRLLFLSLLGASSGAAGCGGASGAEASPNSPAGAAHSLIGTSGPDFAQKTVKDGRAVSLHALHGKVAIVDFWATWCEPCKKSFPRLQELDTKYRSSGLEIVGISQDDDPDGIPTFADALGAKFSLAWDQGKAIASKWRPKSMPTTFVVDRQGIVRFVHFGYHDGEELEIEKEVKGLL